MISSLVICYFFVKLNGPSMLCILCFIVANKFFWKLLMSEIYEEKRAMSLYYMRVRICCFICSLPIINL